jgi:hypothetical protein
MVHGESGWTSKSDICHGWTGSATPGPYEPCRCTGFRPWSGPRDARTGEPVKPLTLQAPAISPERAFIAGAAAERDRIRQLAEARNAVCTNGSAPCDCHPGCESEHDVWMPFADLIGDGIEDR